MLGGTCRVRYRDIRFNSSTPPHHQMKQSTGSTPTPLTLIFITALPAYPSAMEGDTFPLPHSDSRATRDNESCHPPHPREAHPALSVANRPLKPLRPEAAIPRYSRSIMGAILSVSGLTITLCHVAQVVVAENVALFLSIGLRPPATVVFPEPAVNPVGSAEERLARHAGAV